MQRQPPRGRRGRHAEKERCSESAEPLVGRLGDAIGRTARAFRISLKGEIEMCRRVGRMGPIKRGWPRQHNSAGARAPGVKRQSAACTVVYQSTAFPDFEPGHNDGSEVHEGRMQTMRRVHHAVDGKAPSDIPTLEPDRGKLAVRNLRGDDGNGGIIRSPIRAIVLPDPISSHTRRTASGNGSRGTCNQGSTGGSADGCWSSLTTL